MRPEFLLFEHEWQYLIQSLRRDLRRELAHAGLSGESAHHHRFNARLVLRLLQLLNPRSSERGKSDQEVAQFRVPAIH